MSITVEEIAQATELSIKKIHPFENEKIIVRSGIREQDRGLPLYPRSLFPQTTSYYRWDGRGGVCPLLR